MPADLEQELTALRRAVLTMGASVESRVEQVIDSLLSKNIESARRVRVSDHEIDAMELDIDDACMRVLALCHPVAGDLRQVLAVVRMDTDLERIGDHAKSIAKRVIDLEKHGGYAMPEQIHEMARTTQRMLANALRSFADLDTGLASGVRGEDQIVDDRQKEMFAWAEERLPNQPDDTPVILDVLSIARGLERIADLSTNIAEDVMFIVDGEVVRHSEA
ncbi:MAG: phosphate signaling complex protein PhoU [Planctomycetota bacterium]|jgi:phosphate transport system protein